LHSRLFISLSVCSGGNQTIPNISGCGGRTGATLSTAIWLVLIVINFQTMYKLQYA